MLRTLAVFFLGMFSTAAIADGLSYNYVQAAYQHVEIDDIGGFDVDGDGFAFGGSFELADDWHVFGSYGTADFDFGVDFNELLVGVGFHTAISERTDFVANVSYVSVEVDVGGFGSADDDGFGAEIGIRSMVSPDFELAGYITQVELDDSGGETGLRGEAWYSVSETFAVGASIDAADDVTTFGIGGRLYFGR
jgi:hypothetical protein